MVPSPVCSFCGEMDESLEHFFTTCHYSKNFCAEVIKWFEYHEVKIQDLSDKDIMFGILRCEDELFVNHSLLVAKQYPYSCRHNKSPPSIRVFNSKIKMVHLFETMITKSKYKMSAHDLHR